MRASEKYDAVTKRMYRHLSNSRIILWVDAVKEEAGSPWYARLCQIASGARMIGYKQNMRRDFIEQI